MSEVIIIGAGISGLSCAWNLKKLGIDAQILEAGSRPGGVIRTERVNDYQIEWGPNSFQPAPHALEMIDELGIWDDLLGPNPNAPRFVYVNGRLRKFPLGPVSFGGLARILGEPFITSKSSRDESVREFFCRRFGKQAHDRLVAPLLTGMYAADTSVLSVAATFPRMVEMEREHGSLAAALLRTLTRRSKPRGPSQAGTASPSPSKPKPKGSVISFRAGMETLAARLATSLTIRYDVSDAHIGEAPVTVITVPAYRASKIVESQLPELSRLLQRVEYSPMVVAASALPEHSFKEPLRGFGFLAPRGEGLHLLGTLFSSSLFPGRAPEGQVLLTSFLGGSFEPDAVDWPDERLWEIVGSELKRVLKTSMKPQPIALFRHRYAIPQYRIGHERLVNSLKNELKEAPGLFVTGNYLEGISVPACIAQGERAAHAVAEYLRRTA